jgi:hypothetical protein
MRVLAQVGLDDPQEWVADGLDLREHLQDAVLHLLDRVRNSVGPVHLHLAGRLVHRKLVPLQVEGAVCQGQVLNDRVLAGGDVVVVAGVKPPADVQTGDVLAGFVGGIEVRAQRYPSKCCVFGGAWRASSRCETPCHSR